MPIPLLGQAQPIASVSVVPTAFSPTLLWWLMIYVAMLFAWGITATNVTMTARRTAGRSVLVRWASALVGILVFIVVPAFSARLLLPSAVLLAVVPVTFYFLRISRKVGTEVVRGTISGSKHGGFFTYRVTARVITTLLELSWTALQAVLRFDWAKLQRMPEMARQALRLVHRPGSVDSEQQQVVLLQESGLPIDAAADPRLKSFPSSVWQGLLDLLGNAVTLRASEILLATGGQAGPELRYRIDGNAVDARTVSEEEAVFLARAVKTLAELPSSPVAHAQDGIVPMMCGDRRCDAFVSAAPSSGRETLVIRLTGDERRLLDGGLAGLGIDDAALAAVRKLLANREGLVLFVGRADSGKGTTIYAAIRELESSGKSIATVEMSLRHRLEHSPQVKVRGGAPDGFTQAIESALRHDPDALVVRDIGDRETAELCMRTAIAGRLVIAGFRADDAVNALQRLLALGVDRGLMRLALTGVVAQRLTRTLCESCKTPYQPPADLVTKLGLRPKEPLQFQREVGCPKCRGTGFAGRSGVYEVLVSDESLQNAMAGDASIQENRDLLRRAVVRSLQQSAVAKVCRGMTSVQEIVRILK